MAVNIQSKISEQPQTPNQKPNDEKLDEQKTAKSNIRTEWFQFIIALIIIIPFMAYVGIFHASSMSQEAKDILTMLGVFVGTIVGFYFGQKPVQNLTKQVERASEAKTIYKTEAGETVSQALTTAIDLEKTKQNLIETNEKLQKSNNTASLLSQQIELMKKEYESQIAKLIADNVVKDIRNKGRK